ncbi:MAG: AAA family ATPase [Candidatus Thalassarchaeum sp.]
MSAHRLLIIAGTSGVGKSTLSARVASSLRFSKIVSTDTIRETLRTQYDPEQSPALHRSSFEPAGSGVIEDWLQTVKVLSEATQAVVLRAAAKSSDLVLEGVHIIPGEAMLEEWRNSGGEACGVVLRVDDEETHETFIKSRERHNRTGVEHYLDNLYRIREIQDCIVRDAENSGWLSIDASIDENPIAMIEDSFE